MARRIEGNFNQGWGVATFITLLAAAGFLSAYMIKTKTFHSPNDVTAPTKAEQPHAPAPGPVKH